MKNKSINVAKCIYWTYAGTWGLSVYKNGLILFKRQDLKTWREAAAEVIGYCVRFNKTMIDIDHEWEAYFDKCQNHVDYMIAKKGSYTSESEWQMAFSCNAPNEPGYYRANND